MAKISSLKCSEFKDCFVDLGLYINLLEKEMLLTKGVMGTQLAPPLDKSCGSTSPTHPRDH